MRSKSLSHFRFIFISFLLFAISTCLAWAPPAHAQATESVLYSFCPQGGNCTDGTNPNTSLIFDSKGNLYGTTDNGGGIVPDCEMAASYPGCGVVFELSPPSSGSGPWTETVLWNFSFNGDGGVAPYGGLIFDSHGDLYGTTQAGEPNGGGVVFELSPPSGGNGPWTETVLYDFCSLSGCTDGEILQAGVIFDSQGNLYGATLEGGANDNGTVFELIPPSGGSGPWTEQVLWSFGGTGDGKFPSAPLIFGAKGNLFGTNGSGGAYETACNGYGCGTVFELSPPSNGIGPWTETVLWSFGAGNDGQQPESGLIFDSSGNLYGTTLSGGANGDGTVFELSPPSGGSGPWTEKVLWNFGGGDGSYPDMGSLIFDPQGNLYGTASSGGANGKGVVFELSPPSSPSGTWTEDVLWSLDGNDGNDPIAGVISDSRGNLYGPAYFAGVSACPNPNGCGTIIKISPALKSATVTSLTSSPDPSTGGQTVAFTATVSPPPSYSTGLGSVTWTANGSTIGTMGLLSADDGVVQLKYSSLYASVTPYKIVATYNPPAGGSLSGSTSNLIMQTVNAEPTSTTLSSSPNPSTGGQSVAFTATVTAPSGVTPVGTVAFKSGSMLMANVSLSSGVAVLNYSSLIAGTDNITAVYTGSNYMTGSTSNAVEQVVNGFSTGTALASTPNPSKAGQNVTFTATVSASGGGTPTGMVTFGNGTAAIGTAMLNGSGVAVLNYASLPAGTNSIKAVYNGSETDAPSTSAALSQVVNPPSTTTALNSSLNPSTGGQTVTFTAMVTTAEGPTPTGTVSFYNGSNAIGTITLSGGVAKLNYSALVAGTHSITATYNGSATDATSTSAAVSQVVNLDTTTTALTTSPNPSTSGASVTITATVTPGNGVAATGEVSFYSGSTLLGNVSLSGGAATLSHAFTTGSYSLTAKYDGSNYKSGSTSSVVTQTVNP